MKSKRITESELVLPALYLMSINPQRGVKTAELIPPLTKMFNPQGIDAQILNSRHDTHFSQMVRNLKSHDTLDKKGYANYIDGEYFITRKGIELVQRNLENIQYILSSGFNYNDIKSSMGRVYEAREEILPYKEIVVEGEEKIVRAKTYERSRKLRNVAIEYFSHNGIIACNCCGFEFRSFYGSRFGTSCIEIHHLKPVFQYAGVSVDQTIEEALKNLLPVCPNCHRVIHKNHISASMIPLFKKVIQHGV